MPESWPERYWCLVRFTFRGLDVKDSWVIWIESTRVYVNLSHFRNKHSETSVALALMRRMDHALLRLMLIR
eukprot:scaffold2470_cov158-Amphora_coffeaeformis.AAC.12